MKKEITISIIFIIFLALIVNAVVAVKEENTKESNKLSTESLSKISGSKIKVIAEYPSQNKKTANLKIQNTEKELKNKIKHEFNSFNGFSAVLSKEEISDLITKGYNVYEDIEVHAFLGVSVPLVNASKTWQSKQNNINLTGLGQTVCVIDTGVNYSHPDLGGCNPEVLTLNGTISNYINESIHPYENYTNITLIINFTGYSNIALHFTSIITESKYDFVYIYNSSDYLVKTYTGENFNIWTPSVSGDTIKVKFTSDENIQNYGFYIDKVINGTTNLTYNWSSCNKVIGGIDAANNDLNPYDDNGHGTHVTGIISANGVIKGVAPESKIISIKSLNSSGGGDSSDILQGIDWCVNNSEIYNITAISISIGGSEKFTDYCDNTDGGFFANSINLAVRKNISVVVATGNDASSTGISFPSCITNVTRVASSTKTDSLASYSDRNALVHLIAPGGSSFGSNLINSTCMNGLYCGQSGTSMATPHVSGAIAIMKQYLSLTNQTKTPQEIENILNITGKRIPDLTSGLNFSRINIYAAILSIDEFAPNITLVYPQNDSLSLSTESTFRCRAEDLLLKNLSFYLWNSSSNIINLTRADISNQNYTYEINITNLSSGSYRWNCLANDENDNSAFATNNYTFNIGPILTLLLSPSNDSYSSSSNVNFSCSSTSTSSLTNITFYIWNSSNGLIYSNISIKTGALNSSNFTYNFTSEGSYRWNCKSFNNQSNSSFAENNLTFTYDTTYPILNLISPESGYSVTSSSKNIEFTFNTSDNFGLNNCTLQINNGYNETNTSVLNNASQIQSFTRTFTPGSYSWNISCFDYASNYNFSETRTLTVITPVSSSTGSGGSGGGIAGGITHQAISEIQLEEGYSKTFKRGDKILFNLSKEEHSLITREILNDSINLSLRSQEINFTLKIGQTKKFNLTNNENYDISFYLQGINKTQATLLIKKISEKISKEVYPPVNTFENNSDTTEDKINPLVNLVEGKIKGESKLLTYILILALAIFLIIFVLKRYEKKSPKTHKVHVIKYNPQKGSFY